MKSPEDKLAEKLKYSNGYIEISTEKRAELAESLRFARSLVQENNKATEELREELVRLKEAIAKSNDNAWQENMIEMIDDILEDISK